jgi:uroporphyrinogen-III decarboxylase
MESVVTIGSPAVERPRAAGCDDFGVRWDMGIEGCGTYPAAGGRTIADLPRWREQIAIPDVDAMEWSAVETHASGVDREQCLVMGFVEFGLFERSYLLLGMDEALIGYLTAPETMEELIAAVADYKVRLIERFDDAADLDILWYGDDWGTQDNLFVHPQVWRRVIKPHTQRIYDCAKKRGILVNQHSCGKIESVFDDMVEMGADVFNPCQPCNDLARLKKRHAGKIAFCGGIDSQFVLDRPNVTLGEVRAEVRKRIDELAWGGGYIAGPSHGVPYDPAIIDAMNDEIAAYGRRFYRSELGDGTPRAGDGDRAAS